jgi:hypothetical protein
VLEVFTCAPLQSTLRIEVAFSPTFSDVYSYSCVAYPFLSKSDNARAAAITMRLRTAFEPSTSPLSIAVAQVAQNDLVVLRADIARLKANGTFPTTYTLPDTYQVYSQYYLRSKNTKPWDKDVPY